MIGALDFESYNEIFKRSVDCHVLILLVVHVHVGLWATVIGLAVYGLLLL